jgi:hypothetical protein
MGLAEVQLLYHAFGLLGIPEPPLPDPIGY